eukprot:229579-Chlamydomonas_euryale.AAC.1
MEVCWSADLAKHPHDPLPPFPLYTHSQVAKGYREAIPEGWPQPVRELIEACWSGEPAKRPTMEHVSDKLREWRLDARLVSVLEPLPLPPESSSSE